MRETDCQKKGNMPTYLETFDSDPGGWFGWISNTQGPRPLEIRQSRAISRSPWWIDYNHAPPGAGYLHLLYMLFTAGVAGEHQHETAGPNRFITAGHGTDFTHAQVTLRLKGEVMMRGAQLHLLCQGVHEGICTGWLLTGQAFTVTPDWSEQTVVCTPDKQQWTCLGSRHDRTDYYGRTDLDTVLKDVNTDILFVLYPLDVVPMEPLDENPHVLRPERDYPVWRSRLPEGYVMLDEVRIEFPD